jgi:hypothetical protein
MPDWFTRFIPDGWSEREFGYAIFAFAIGSAVISLGMVAFVVVRLPADYFVGDHPPKLFVDRHPLVRWPLVILKNLFGLLLVAVGVIMSVPGVPGQGFLTILIGCLLLDFPGKRKVERFILRRRSVDLAITKLRARFGKPPLQLDAVIEQP